MNSTAFQSKPYPLGAQADEHGVNFALFSANAEAVELCLFDHRERERRVPLSQDGDIWHTYLAGLKPGQHYGYRVYGPYAPESGHRFNPHKLLLDPYAKAISGELRWDNSVFGYLPGHPDGDLSFNPLDSAASVPKSVVTQATELSPPRLNQKISPGERVIYEAHAKGLSQLHPDIDRAKRGKVNALAEPALIEHLQALGINTLELLPLHYFIDECFLQQRGLSNYWGYNTLNFFTPHAPYLDETLDPSEHALAVQQTLKALQAAGIDVWLDVVYNHTAESDEYGPTLCYRGIDNTSYYRLNPHEPRYYINDTGCGNCLRTEHPAVMQLVMDSLRHWHQVIGFNGFRFDLASNLAREPHGFRSDAPLLQAIRQDPSLQSAQMVAEPWDIGPGGYRLGQFPSRWLEWNDQFRDVARRFWLGQPGLLPALAERLHGSAQTFEHNRTRPHASVNFITSHDGFTLRDLVSYEQKHNRVNGERNQDGHNHNFSHNFGHEGPSADPMINNARRRQERNLLATLLLAQGTPMLCAGSEIGQTQRGNNNAYCQDNAISWLDWANADQPLLTDSQAIIGFRKQYAAFFNGPYRHHSDQIRWINLDGNDMSDENWQDAEAQTLIMLLHNAADEASLLLYFHAGDNAVEAKLPSGYPWRLVFSNQTKKPVEPQQATFSLSARSVVAFHQTPPKQPSVESEP